MPGADRPLTPNVGRLDAIARFVAGVGILAGTFFVATRFPEGWLLSLVLFPALAAAYLLLSAGSRTDVFYHLFGLDTTRRRRRPHPRVEPPPLAGGRRAA